MKELRPFAAASIFALLLVATRSEAQPQLRFGIGPDGRPEVGVRDPERERYERREIWRQRRDEERARAYEEGRRDAARERRYGAYGDERYGTRCRTVMIRDENEWGRMVTRRIRRCS
jgi:hypothetical protein